MKRLLRLIKPQFDRSVATMKIREPADLLEAAHWIEARTLRLQVPVAMLRMQGAFVYDASHPFVQALAHGPDRLSRFYAATQPADLADYYRLRRSGAAGETLPPWELPWYLRDQRKPPPGEADLGPEHGVSFYGPVTERKIQVEMARLQSAADSIRRVGYDPDRHGDIEGYVLRSGDAACFFVRGGKHRTAALSFLGLETIPVCFRGSLPRVVDEAQASAWPLVRSGAMAPEVATRLLRAYTHPSTTLLA